MVWHDSIATGEHRMWCLAEARPSARSDTRSHGGTSTHLIRGRQVGKAAAFEAAYRTFEPCPRNTYGTHGAMAARQSVNLETFGSNPTVYPNLIRTLTPFARRSETLSVAVPPTWRGVNQIMRLR